MAGVSIGAGNSVVITPIITKAKPKVNVIKLGAGGGVAPPPAVVTTFSWS